MSLDITRHHFQSTLYEIPSDFDNKSTIEFVSTNKFVDEGNLTTYYNTPNVLEDKKLIDLKNHVYQFIEIFTKQIMNRKSFSIDGSWLQAYRESDFHSLHTHNLNLNDFSLIFYIQCTEESSSTVFFNLGYPYINSPSIEVKAEKSKFVIFPGGLPHSVPPNKDKERIVFSCNFKLSNE